MKYLLFVFSLVLTGCSSTRTGVSPTPEISTPTAVIVRPDIVFESDIVSPLDPQSTVGYQPTYKRFGEYVEDRFRGYHTGEDLEVPRGNTSLVPVRAIADGEIVYRQNVNGYGGVIIMQHTIDDETISSLYGHLDLDSTKDNVGDNVTKGQFLANLGADKSEDTDGERQHLHFGMWKGNEMKLAGYAQTPAALSDWINPFDFLTSHDAIQIDESKWSNSSHFQIPGTAFDQLSFEIPDGWDIEYIPSIESLNLYDARGEGSARERSQVLIRYFDAANFLTLSTVNVLSSRDLTVGEEKYTARQYEIQKKAGVANFKDQPTWRNERHIVTDFRSTEGQTRHYVVAARPDLDSKMYERILSGMKIQKD